ncbi:hypothetical protein B9Z55_026387 [Caenorhabditis nigoni]|uniref:Uncharacterized protein n=1 Tax=Caenorhabditis nigoni TaxID=1611254 RepID=A0A2G5T2Y5_9PELO|nr:hypothetical protein B9Z55_026387 [Caenorhabditis nigoni]
MLDQLYPQKCQEETDKRELHHHQDRQPRALGHNRQPGAPGQDRHPRQDGISGVSQTGPPGPLGTSGNNFDKKCISWLWTLARLTDDFSVTRDNKLLEIEVDILEEVMNMLPVEEEMVVMEEQTDQLELYHHQDRQPRALGHNKQPGASGYGGQIGASGQDGVSGAPQTRSPGSSEPSGNNLGKDNISC